MAVRLWTDMEMQGTRRAIYQQTDGALNVKIEDDDEAGTFRVEYEEEPGDWTPILTAIRKGAPGQPWIVRWNENHIGEEPRA